MPAFLAFVEQRLLLLAGLSLLLLLEVDRVNGEAKVGGRSQASEMWVFRQHKQHVLSKRMKNAFSQRLVRKPLMSTMLSTFF